MGGGGRGGAATVPSRLNELTKLLTCLLGHLGDLKTRSNHDLTEDGDGVGVRWRGTGEDLVASLIPLYGLCRCSQRHSKLAKKKTTARLLKDPASVKEFNPSRQNGEIEGEREREREKPRRSGRGT